ncbi:amino acid adenylation domain-containing protein [Echinicola soli]|uniref:Amino acid adenylation domain-containing protein n=1 Tax=Echinicola soli TaxID=2591634 RepID=A0A514CI50_9BACT|nr:non-ribosomal peptide synthetase [Echinicola soli]QDH79509.1 amino acid adenylation domain-containing protein [Echinicola soli]
MNPDLTYKVVDYDPFGCPIEKAYASITSQREIWLACKIGGDDANRAYNESISLVLKGKLDQSSFLEALQEVIKRHEALRAIFAIDGQQILIQEEIPFSIHTQDISSLDTTTASEYIDQFKREDSLTAFDLESGPLFRMALHKFCPSKHCFTLTIHHIIGDGWSLGVILEDICKIYNAKVQQVTSLLPVVNPLSDYCQQITALESMPEHADTISFWLEKFNHQTEDFSLPIDHIRPELKEYKSERLDFKAPKTQIDQIHTLGKSVGVSLVNTFIIAFELFLSKKSQHQEVVLGIPAAGQSATGLFNLVGHCVNLLPLKSKVDNNTSFRSFLKQRNEEILDCYDHQLFTYSSLLNKLNRKRDLSRTALVPVIFNLDMGMDSLVQFYGLEHELISNPRAFDNFELALNLTNCKDSYQFEWSYRTTLFEKATIVRMMEEFNRLLQTVVSHPETLLRDIYLFDPVKLVHFYEKWNHTEHAYPKNVPFTRLVHAMANQFPTKTAIEFQNQLITYKELEDQSNRFAAFLQSKKFKKGDRIGLFMPRSADMVIGLLGIIKSGVTYIPIDPELPHDRIHHMLMDASAKAIVTTTSIKNIPPAAVQLVFMEDFHRIFETLPNTYQEANIQMNDPVYILYTSGSTGLPKGVQVNHQNLTNLLYSLKDRPGISYSERVLAVTTISFDVAGMELFGPLVAGATVVIADTPTLKDGRLLLKALREKNITRVFSTPATYQMLVQVGWDYPLPLKIISGGEPFQRSLVEKLLPITEEIWNAYGPTETTIQSSLKLIEAPDDFDSIGTPINNTEIYLLDEHRQLVDIGEVGEIYIGGDGIALGYWQKPDLSQERFIPNPFDNTGKLMYKTGDLGKFKANGELMCLGRIDNQVKIRGHRIELGEIEQQINLLEGIMASYVMLQESQQGHKQLVAYVTCTTANTHKEASTISDETQKMWKANIQAKLPEYMLPSHWVVMKQFPLTPNGKIDHKALPLPTSKTLANPTADHPEWSTNEKLVGEIWKKSLQLTHINLDDDFFELGGHSILAVEVMSSLDKKIDTQLPLTTIFKHSTVRAFAALLENREKTEEIRKEWSSLVPIKPDGSKPPIYVIHGVAANITNYYKLIEHVNKDQPIFGLQAKGLNGIDTPNSGLENIAAHYVNEILQHNPEGPYHIGGYSFGGYVAFEMARQLIEKNKALGKLIIFDTSVEPEDEEKVKTGLLEMISKELNKRKVEMQLLVEAPNTFRTTKGRMIKRKAENLLTKIGLQKDRSPYDRAAIIKKIKEINKASMLNYSLRPINADLILFRTRIKLAPVKEEKYYGWAPYVNAIQVIDIDGDHNSMFEPPFVAPFASKLQETLDGIT